MNVWVAEGLALGAQCLFFTVVMAISVAVGMVMAAYLDGPGGLLVATIVSGAGLLLGANLSQALHDRILGDGTRRKS
jgi:hypothetical protein